MPRRRNEPNGDETYRRHLARVTPERLAKSENYRLQMNIDKRLQAYGYNALAYHYGRNWTNEARNWLRPEIENDLKQLIQRHIESDPSFSDSIRRYINKKIDDRLEGEAVAFYEELGWKG